VPVKHTMPVGVKVELDTDRGALIITESVVSGKGVV